MKSFGEIFWMEFPQQYYQTIKQEILSNGKEYILKVDENEYVDYLAEKYKIEPINIISDSETISEPVVDKELRRDMFGKDFISDVYIFTVSYQFTGHSGLFRVKPNPYTWSSYDIDVNPRSNSV